MAPRAYGRAAPPGEPFWAPAQASPGWVCGGGADDLVWRHALLPECRIRPVEAPHAAPRPRGPALPRGADGRGGLLVGLLAAVPRGRPVGHRRLPGVGAP